MRGRGKRSWVKIWVTGWLHGSIRWQLLPDERGVWADLIVLAGECSQDGAICDNDSHPYPRDFIANQLNISQELLDRTIAKCRHEGRLVDNDDILHIVNWAAYQSEYDRVKKYRRPKDDDPNRYLGGKFGHLVARTQDDIDQIKNSRQK
jgi:hypothetical protein